LLGEHVPYPVEAFPEGNQRHLSAESGLYCRIFTEGLFGIRPTGLNQFTVTPQMPDDWKIMKLRNTHGFQHTYNIEVERVDAKIRVKVTAEKGVIFDQTVQNGTPCNVKML
jgi:cellobiose phosphorylase